MGALYIIAGVVIAGMLMELVTFMTGDEKVGEYDYNFAMGVGAVFGTAE